MWEIFRTETRHEKRLNFLLNYWEGEERCHWKLDLSSEPREREAQERQDVKIRSRFRGFL